MHRALLGMSRGDEPPAEVTSYMAAPKRGPAIVAGIGALFIALGPFATFGQATLTLSGISGPAPISGDSVQGIDTADGKFFVAAGVLLLVAAIVMRSSSSVRARTVGTLFVLFGSLFVMVMAAIDLFTIANELKEDLLRVLASGEEVPGSDPIRDLMTVRLGPGLFLVIVGGILGVLAGTAGMVLQTQPSESVVS
jgi:hypothetical protein